MPPCVVKRLKPQPSAKDPLWKGHKPGDGAIYTRVCPVQVAASSAVAGPIGGLPQTFWAQDTPAVAIDPAVLAQQAVDKMLLEGPDLASPRSTGKYTVGVPMWMWVDQSPTTFGPNTATASGGGVTVSATAKVSSIEWDLGDASDSVHCDGPGTPYKESFGMKESPDCGHLFRTPSKGQPGGKYQGTAKATWTVEWQVSGGGEFGQFTEVRTTDFAVSVGELKVLD